MSLFKRELLLMTRWPYVRQARAALAFSDPRAESPGESLARILISELGIGEVDLQFPLPVAGRTAFADLRVGCHVFEFDGRQKYRTAEHGGLATRELEDVVWAEKLREIEIRELGLGVSRIVWADLWGERRQRGSRPVASRVRPHRATPRPRSARPIGGVRPRPPSPCRLTARSRARPGASATALPARGGRLLRRWGVFRGGRPPRECSAPRECPQRRGRCPHHRGSARRREERRSAQQGVVRRGAGVAQERRAALPLVGLADRPGRQGEQREARRKPRLGSCSHGTGPWPFQPLRRSRSSDRW